MWQANERKVNCESHRTCSLLDWFFGAAARRLMSRRGEPLFYADWLRTVFITMKRRKDLQRFMLRRSTLHGRTGGLKLFLYDR